MNASNEPGDQPPFPAFASLAEAEAYSYKIGDACFEICYHLEGNLNLLNQRWAARPFLDP